MMTSLEIYKHASFFKILLFGFSSKLRIPKEFVKKYGEIILHEEAIFLKTGDDESGKSWKVNIKPVLDHHDKTTSTSFCFTGDNWPEFVEDNNICEMDFLVFNLVSKSTFQVAIYGKDGVMKEPAASSLPCRHCGGCGGQTSQRKFADGLQCETESDEEEESKNKSITVRKINKYRMEIPKALAMETGIARKNAIKLQNEGGKKWRVNIFNEKNGAERIFMTKGWNAFRKENKLYFGTKFRFELDDANSGNLIVKKERAKNDNVMMRSGKRGRGRPRKSKTVMLIIPPIHQISEDDEDEDEDQQINN